MNGMSEDPKDLISLLQQNISRVVLGKADAVRLAVVALLAGAVMETVGAIVSGLLTVTVTVED